MLYDFLKCVIRKKHNNSEHPVDMIGNVLQKARVRIIIFSLLVFNVNFKM